MQNVFSLENRKTDEEVAQMGAQLDEQDYENAKAGTAFLLRLNKMSPRVLGTPMIFIEGQGGEVVSAYGAITESEEWSKLVEKVQ